MKRRSVCDKPERFHGACSVYGIKLVIVAFIILIPSFAFAQTTIWLEDFNSYANGTIQGSGTPPKWTRDVSNCDLSGQFAHFSVQNKLMEGRNLNGEAVWTSQTIYISAYANVAISTNVSMKGNMEPSDYIRFYYKLDGGPETLFAVNGNISNDFSALVASQSGLNGNTLVIVVRESNNAKFERHRFDNMKVTGTLIGDNCSVAIPVNEVFDLPFSTNNMTASGANPGCGGTTNPKDIWYAYTATQTGNAVFSLCGSDFDTRLAVWDGCGGNVLACNDDAYYCSYNTSNSILNLSVTSGTTYYVQVSGHNALTGDGYLTISVSPPPTNDLCANAISITGDTSLSYTTVGATASGERASCVASSDADPVDIWYAYTAPVTGVVNIGLCNSYYDSQIAVWDACGGTDLACNDDDGPLCPSKGASVQLNVTASTTYYIQVFGWNGATGNGDLIVQTVPQPTNDDCAYAAPVHEVTDTAFTTTVGATAGGDNPGCGGTTNPVDIWYAYTPTASGYADFDLCGSSFDTRLAIWDGCGGNVLSCNDDDDFCATNSLQSHISMRVDSNTTYYVQVGGHNALTGTGDLTISLIPLPTNDKCSNAIAVHEVTNLPFTTQADATAGGDNPGCGGTANPVDIWYAYTPTASGTVLFSLCGSSFDTRIALWDGCGGNVLACDDDDGPGCSGTNASLEYDVVSSKTYYVQVGGYNGATGNGKLSINFVTIPNGQWVGVVNSDWATSGNWVNGVIPTSLIDTRIVNAPPNFPKVKVTANCNNLFVDKNDSITIDTGSDIKAAGDFQNYGVFTMNSGSFNISGNLNTSSTSKTDIKGGTLSMNGWFENGPSTYAKGTIKLSAGTINVATDVLLDSTNSGGVMNGPFYLNVSKSLEMDSSSFSTITGGTITMKGSGHIYSTSKAGSFAAFNLTVDGTGNYYFSRNGGNNSFNILNNFNVLTGTATFLSNDGTGMPENFSVKKNISVSTGASINADVNNKMTLVGDLANNGTFTHNSGLFVFNGNTTISGSSPVSFGNTIINSGKILTGPVSGAINISGDFTDNGTYNNNNGTLEFNGITQAVGGTSAIAFYNLTIDAGSTTTIAATGNTLSNILKSNGTLNTGGNLTLLSTSSQTALIDGSGSGSVSGTVHMQRYLSSGFGYRYVSSPFSSATASEFSPYVNLAASFPPLYRYDENRTSSGWVNYSVPANPLEPLRGYALNFGTNASPLTFEMSGDVSNGSVSPLTLYNHNQTYTTGFNLVGNPYPSPIDWDASNGWTRTNIDDAVYYFNPSTSDQYGGTYSSYINGVSSDGVATGIISSMQGFFVHVSDGTYPVTATLAVNNNVRVNDLSPIYHKKSTQESDHELFRLCADYSGKAVSDPLVIYFNDSASVDFQQNRDALKIMNSDSDVPSLYAISSDKRKLSIYSVPYLVDSMRIVPVGLKVEKDEIVTFRCCKVANIAPDIQIYLHDKKQGVYQNLTLNQEYKINLPAGEYNERFSILFTQKDIHYKVSENEMFYAYSFRNKVYVYINLPTTSQSDVVVANLLGQVIWRGKFYGNGYHEFLLNVERGIYLLSIRSNSGYYSKKLLISND